ncbi:MAG: hypothetical protein IIW77_06800 [Bacteroidaceae bacterium]|nr:hypothetical protein [Bacteroidaceae bacterium]
MKKLFSIFALLFCVGIMSCENEYDADTAESYYEPAPGKRVASLKTTYTSKGNEYSFEHHFSYDAKGRIKSVNSNIVHYVADKVYFDTVYTRCDITSSADYFYNGEELEVAYSVTREYPTEPSRNNAESGVDYGVFNNAGVLTRFSSVDFVYSTTKLEQGFSDGDAYFNVQRDGNGNVSGYTKYRTTTDEQLVDKSGRYFYTPFKNKTNFDFSAYFGYWGVEQGVRMISVPYYATYQLAAFGMLGATSENLPWGVKEKGADGKEDYIYGEWELDSQDYPLWFVDTDGRKTVITYCE